MVIMFNYHESDLIDSLISQELMLLRIVMNGVKELIFKK